MYAMSWERNTRDAKFESIQDPYSVEFEEYDIEKDLSLDELLEKEIELDEVFDMFGDK